MPATRLTPPSDAELAALAARLGSALAARGWRAATAESCTGGWIAKAITDVAGASAWFDAGYVTYADTLKARELDVAPALLEAHGAVSEPVVRAMAMAARRKSGADVAVAVSGIAGPGGGTAAKPVGTVCLAWESPAGIKSEQCRFDGDREAVRRLAVAHALGGLIACTSGADT